MPGSDGGGNPGDEPNVTICHRPEGGEPVTLTLPLGAARAHLAQHPEDTVGACPITVVVPAEPEVAAEEVVEPPAE